MLNAAPTAMSLALSVAVPFLVFGAVAWLVQRGVIRIPPSIDASLSSSWAPRIAGALTAVFTLFVWGSFAEPGVVHDEQAYLLQARIFAGGHWTGPVPPLPEFFEQTHVFVEPHLAAKYPPGHSLLLVPGIWLGLAGLVPLILSGVAGSLVFAIARRIGESTVALMTWALWSTSAASLYWRATYFSQSTSGVLWLLSLWAVLRWKAECRGYQLAIVFGALGWMYLTRPLTAIALGAPIIAFVLLVIWKRKLWRQLALPLALVVPILLLNFVWQERTLGHWLTSPYAEYSRVYFPFVKPGFGVDPTPPLRRVPEIEWVGQQFIAYHAAHRPLALPGILLQRVVSLLFTLGQQWRGFLIMLFLAGAFRTRGPARFGAISGLLLMAAYLAYAHPPAWIVYYAEIFPVFFYVASQELLRFGRTAMRLDASQLRSASIVMVVLMTPFLASDLIEARQVNDERSRFHRTAAKVLEAIPERPAVVFVHYPRNHNYHRSLIENAPDYRTAPIWLVYDRGPANGRLLHLTDRVAYRLDTETWKLERVR